MKFAGESLADLLNIGQNPSKDIELVYNVGQKLLFDCEKSLEILAEISKDAPYTTELDMLQSVFQSTLEIARLAKESGQKVGKDFLQAMEDSLQVIAERDGISSAVSFTLSKIWVDSGLMPPDSVAIKIEGLDKIKNLNGDEIDEIFPVFDELFKKLEAVAFDNLHKIYDIMVKNLGVIPPQLRYWFVRRAVSRPVPIYGELGCALLFSLQEEVRTGAINGLQDRLAKNNISAKTLASLKILQNWLTEENLKQKVGRLIEEGVKCGHGEIDENRDITIHDVYSSSIDGAGIQSIFVTFTNGGTHYVAMLLIQTSDGIKDAMVVNCKSETEMKSLINVFTRELESVEVFKVTKDYMENALSAALSAGIQMGITPNPGLVEFAMLAGQSNLLTTKGNVEFLLDLNSSHRRIEKLSARDRNNLLQSAENLFDDLKMIEYWLECTEHTDQLMTKHKSAPQKKDILWQHVEQKRDHWTMILARVALLLDNANDKRTDSILATALAMQEHYDVRKIPIMQKIVEQSLNLWSLGHQEEVNKLVTAQVSNTVN